MEIAPFDPFELPPLELRIVDAHTLPLLEGDESDAALRKEYRFGKNSMQHGFAHNTISRRTRPLFSYTFRSGLCAPWTPTFGTIRTHPSKQCLQRYSKR